MIRLPFGRKDRQEEPESEWRFVEDQPDRRAPRFPPVRALMTAPRLGFTDNQQSAFAALMPLRVELRIIRGAWWGQCMTRGFEQLTADGRAKYILTLDYDTVFDANDVLRLVATAEQHPECHALAALQMRRGVPNPLFYPLGHPWGESAPFEVTGGELNAEVYPVATAHFGLTVFQAQAIRSLARPWFMAEPDEHSGWGDGHLDDDMWFWRQWQRGGLRVAIAPRIPVGHIEEMVTWPNDRLRPAFQYTNDYHAAGRPSEGIWR